MCIQVGQGIMTRGYLWLQPVHLMCIYIYIHQLTSVNIGRPQQSRWDAVIPPFWIFWALQVGMKMGAIKSTTCHGMNLAMEQAANNTSGQALGWRQHACDMMPCGVL